MINRKIFRMPGDWNESDYLSLDMNRHVEFTDGNVEVLALPKPAHQRIVSYLCDELCKIVRSTKIAEVLFAPMPVRLRPGKFREPDLMLMLGEHSDRKCEDYWDGADLVIEVVSPDAASHERDHTKKRADYAEAGIPEYWIVDPVEKKIIVLTLHRGEYVTHGEFESGQTATSSLLPGFSISVDAVFGAAVEA